MNKEKLKKIKREQENQKNKKQNNEPVEEQSKFEKILYRLILIIGVGLILVIILGTIITGGDKQKIANKYKSLTKDNVFETIKYKELVEKINNKEKFQLLLISDYYQDADYYIYCVDAIVKEINEKNGTEEKIYIIDPLYLDNQEKKLFTEVDKDILKTPNLILYEHTDSTVVDNSVDGNSTIRYFVSEYENNYYNLLVKYLLDCYEE